MEPYAEGVRRSWMRVERAKGSRGRADRLPLTQRGHRQQAAKSLQPSPTRGEGEELLPQHFAGDDHAHDLVGAFKDRMDPQIAPETLDRIVAQIAIAAE